VLGLRARRGVTTYVATLITAIIALSAGFIVFVYSYSIVDSYANSIAERARGAERSLSVAVLASYITPSGDLVVICSTGSRPATLRALYVNESLVECTVSFDGVSGKLSGRSAITIPYRTAFVVECSVGSARVAYVKLVFDEGEVVSRAGAIG
jgi:hypothetical protein